MLENNLKAATDAEVVREPVKLDENTITRLQQIDLRIKQVAEAANANVNALNAQKEMILQTWADAKELEGHWDVDGEYTFVPVDAPKEEVEAEGKDSV